MMVFFLTMGMALQFNLDNLLAFHKQKGTKITLTAVRPNARFGEINITDGIVSSFKEKPQLHEGWINGGFFVVDPGFFDYISGDEMLEREPMERAVSDSELSAFRYDGFWQCMDSKRDLDYLISLYDSGNAPWIRDN